MINLVFDQFDNAVPLPNLCKTVDGIAQIKIFPYVNHLRLLYYCEDHGVNVNIRSSQDAVNDKSYYPIGIEFFSFDVDYFYLLTEHVRQQCRLKKIKILFYYHEADSPIRIKQYLDSLCIVHQLPQDCYVFVSANTLAQDLSNFLFFPDHELFYWRLSSKQVVPEIHFQPRSRDFTLLSRTHKWWRATVVALLHQHQLLHNSHWSYNNVDIGDTATDNPIRLFKFPDLESYITEFLKGAPYSCDSQTSDQHNDHSQIVSNLYNDSYCHLIVETHWDADGGGSFLTEKTFKAIRNLQPFVIFGTAESLALLRSLGYRTFDQYIDNSYDREHENSNRLIKLLHTVRQLKQQDLDQWYKNCAKDIVYNQQLFLSSKQSRVNNLFTQLYSHAY